jgi:hypothetical protein
LTGLEGIAEVNLGQVLHNDRALLRQVALY